MIQLNLSFFDIDDGGPAAGTDGYNFADFFSPHAIEAAENAIGELEATRILAAAYLGPDTERVGVHWLPRIVDTSGCYRH